MTNREAAHILLDNLDFIRVVMKTNNPNRIIKPIIYNCSIIKVLDRVGDIYLLRFTIRARAINDAVNCNGVDIYYRMFVLINDILIGEEEELLEVDNYAIYYLHTMPFSSINLEKLYKLAPPPEIINDKRVIII